MILYGLEHLINAGIREIGVILGPVKEDVTGLLGDGSSLGVKITYIDQPDPKGLAHAIAISQDFLNDEPFTMYLGDNLLKQGAKPLIDLFEKNQDDCVVAVAKVKEPSRYGIAIFDEKGKIKCFMEKPKQPVSNLALIGVYVFNNRVFDAVKRIKPSWRGELEITDAIQVLLENGAKVEVQTVQGWWKDTGRPEDLLEANQLVLQELQPLNEGHMEDNASTTGAVRIGRDTVVHSRTEIRGPVAIGQRCEIGPNSYIGPHTSIGNDVVIRNSEVENSIVMDGAHIDCGKRIVDSLIGSKANIFGSEKNLPRGMKLILGDLTYVSV